MHFLNNKILVVDDDEGICGLLSQALTKEGYKAITATDGRNGLEKARREEPSLILLDVNMPGMDGIQFCSELRKDPLLELMPVIILSARSDAQTKVILLESGADDYVPKPFDTSELLSRIKALFRRSGTRTIEKRFSIKLAHKIIGSFERRRYHVYSTLVPSLRRFPSIWYGPPPDILAEKGKKRKAISMERMETLLDPKTIERWKNFIGNTGVILTIIVHSVECRKVARMLQREYGIQCKIILERVRKNPEKSFLSSLNLYRYVPLPWMVLLSLCVFLSICYSIFFLKALPPMVNRFVQGFIINLAFYQPKDDERMVNEIDEIPEEWKKQIKEELKKSLKKN